MSAEKKLDLGDGIFLALFALAIFAGSWLLSSRSAPSGEPDPVVYDERVHAEPDPFVADVRALAQLVEQRFSYLEHRRSLDGLDLAALESAALAELGAEPDDATFRRAVRRFVAQLRDGHAWVHFAGTTGLPSDRHWPFTALLVAEGVMVDGVHPDAAQVLQRGDLVRAVDDTDIEAHLERVAREVYASSDGARRRRALVDLTSWADSERIELTLERAGGEVLVVSVDCPLIRLTIPTPAALPADRDARMLAGDVAYFRPGDFTAPPGNDWMTASADERRAALSVPYAELEATFATFAGARALVLDLRGNPGGTDLLGQALAGHLLPAGFPYYRLSSLRRDGWSTPPPSHSSAPDPEHVFLGRLVCLIDERTFSVADNLAACLRDVHPDVTFVGRNTGAGTGAPRAFRLPRTATDVTFCTMRVKSPNGATIEGSGVAPDVTVGRTRADVLSGRDTTLEAALELLGDSD